MGNIVQRSGLWHFPGHIYMFLFAGRQTYKHIVQQLQTNINCNWWKLIASSMIFFFCSSWLLLNLPKNLQVLCCSFNNTGPGLNHLFSLESKIYSEKANLKLQCVESYFVSPGTSCSCWISLLEKMLHFCIKQDLKGGSVFIFIAMCFPAVPYYFDLVFDIIELLSI